MMKTWSKLRAHVVHA